MKTIIDSSISSALVLVACSICVATTLAAPVMAHLSKDHIVADRPFSTDTTIFLAQTQGMDNRQERRDDRQEDRGDRQDTRQECREAEGVGKDKRDCKQDARQDRKTDE